LEARIDSKFSEIARAWLVESATRRAMSRCGRWRFQRLVEQFGEPRDATAGLVFSLSDEEKRPIRVSTSSPLLIEVLDQRFERFPALVRRAFGSPVAAIDQRDGLRERTPGIELAASSDIR
jgi:hypothetical protein